jgi:hypothetical protein
VIDLRDRINPSRERTFKILQHLPVWQSAASEGSSDESEILRVKANQSLILRKAVYIDALTMASRGRFISESSDAICVITKLGGQSLNTDAYAFRYILPYYDPPCDEPVQLDTVKKLLNLLLDHGPYPKKCKRMIRQTRLIPNLRGHPRYGHELYSPANKIFAECFRDDASAFPHPSVQQLPLEVFGLQTNVDKSNLFICLSRLEATVNTASDKKNVWSRCQAVWDQWKQEASRLAYEQWRRDDLARLSKIRCVPGYRPERNPSYRQKFMENQHAPQVFTLDEVYDPAYIPIAWTSCVFASSKPPEHLYSIGFMPSVLVVVEHLVKLTTHFADLINIECQAFFSDLLETYNFLSTPDKINRASEIIKSGHADAKIWLNDDSPLDAAFVQAHARSSDKPISSLTWLKSSAILHGVPYDLPSRGFYSAKPSLEPYSTLLRACGSHVVKNIKATSTTETIEDHGQQMLLRLRNIREKQPNLCDITIQVEGETYHAHRILLAIVSPYFNRLCVGEWKEETGVLILDGETYGTSNSVASFLEWVYHGYIELDDGALKKDDLDQVQARLDHYLDCLEISNVWDVPEFRAHVEKRILRYEGLFIRIENVSDVLDLATRYHAEKLKAYCNEVISANKDLIDLVVATSGE